MERYTLTDWIIERRADGWYFSTYRERQNRRSWKGPYSSPDSIALMLARQLRKEIAARCLTNGQAA